MNAPDYPRLSEALFGEVLSTKNFDHQARGIMSITGKVEGERTEPQFDDDEQRHLVRDKLETYLTKNAIELESWTIHRHQEDANRVVAEIVPLFNSRQCTIPQAEKSSFRTSKLTLKDQIGLNKAETRKKLLFRALN